MRKMKMVTVEIGDDCVLHPNDKHLHISKSLLKNVQSLCGHIPAFCMRDDVTSGIMRIQMIGHLVSPLGRTYLFVCIFYILIFRKNENLGFNFFLPECLVVSLPKNLEIVNR